MNSFKYDPLGRRIEKSSTATTSVFAYDGNNLIEEANSFGAVVSRYMQSQNIDEPLAMLRSSATRYYNADGLGSVTSLTNSAGLGAQSYTYDSFGNVTASSGSLTNPFQYTGREMDTETGLYYYRARYYDPNAGRFLSEDPIRFNSGQINFYDYVANSPVGNLDPLGLAFCTILLNAAEQSGWMSCFPNDPRKPSLSFSVASGNNGEGTRCKNNSACSANENQGPIPLGLWQWTIQPNSKGSVGGRTLSPVPGTGTNESEGRTGILTHWCANPFGPSTTAPFCSGGCVTATQSNINSLNNLIDSEPGSTLLVMGTPGGQE